MIVTRWPRPVTPIDLEAVTASFTTIAVEPLRSDNAADLVRAVAQGDLSSERIDEIVSRCGGVPLLLEEVTRSTIDQADAGAAAPVAHRSSSSVPPELQLVVESRLGRWPNLKGIIEAASVLGREFSVGLLESLLAGAPRGGRRCAGPLHRSRPVRPAGIARRRARQLQARTASRRGLRDAGQPRLPAPAAFARRRHADRVIHGHARRVARRAGAASAPRRAPGRGDPRPPVGRRRHLQARRLRRSQRSLRGGPLADRRSRRERHA